MSRILVIDDDPNLSSSFARLLKADGHDVETAGSAEAGIETVRRSSPDMVVMDVRLPGMSGLDCLRELKNIDPHLPIIIMTAYGTTETAIEATKSGAYDYILKPFEIPEMLGLIAQALKAGQAMRSRVSLGQDQDGDEAIDVLVGRSKPIQEVYKTIGRVSGTDATVLVRGESGTGKELVARAIYQHSARSMKPLLVINCVAIPETLLESELFGYEKGAFTGAVSRRVGKIEQANRGTVFLDEIGDMPVQIQAKILRLLQEKCIERLGGRDSQQVDVRIIAATNRDLETLISQGRFREDLYFRLNVVTINLPPLRERNGDIPLLAEYFLRRLSREMSMDNPGVSQAALEVMSAYPWPGNVRELGNAMQKALIFSRGCQIGEKDIFEAIFGQGDQAAELTEDAVKALRKWVRQALAAGGPQASYDAIMDRMGGLVISEALSLSGGNRSRASRMLGLSRPTLLSKIDKYGLKSPE